MWFVRAHAARALGAFERHDLAAAVARLPADESWWVRAAPKKTLTDRPAAILDLLVGYLAPDDPFARNGAAEVLQDTGALDALVEPIVRGDAEPDLETLPRILRAGGRRLVVTTAVRNGLEPARLEALVPAGA